jgi:hypothetical protein
MTKTIGVIGSGKHFIEKIYPILIKSDFFKLSGILRKKNILFKRIKLFDEKSFLEINLILFIFLALINITKNTLLNR